MARSSGVLWWPQETKRPPQAIRAIQTEETAIKELTRRYGNARLARDAAPWCA